MTDLQLELQKRVDDRLITANRHQRLPLTIYNYTPKCAFSKAWDSYTLAARGLVLADDGRVVAKPFTKFFNYGELPALPNMPYTVTEKMDGSLGIIFRYEDEIVLTTRGKFDSPQAIVGQRLLEKYDITADSLPDTEYDSSCFLVEIVTPETRVVVNYPESDLYLLAFFIEYDKPNITELYDWFEHKKPWKWFEDMPIPEEYDPLPIADLLAQNPDNREGFVLRYADGTRVKVKFQDYIEKHRIATHLSEKSIYEALRDGKWDEYKAVIPDELQRWAVGVAGDLQNLYKSNSDYVENAWDAIQKAMYLIEWGEIPILTRKDHAMKIQKDHPKIKHILFKKRDGKDYSKDVWEIAWDHYWEIFHEK